MDRRTVGRRGIHDCYVHHRSRGGGTDEAGRRDMRGRANLAVALPLMVMILACAVAVVGGLWWAAIQ